MHAPLDCQLQYKESPVYKLMEKEKMKETLGEIDVGQQSERKT